MDIDVRKIRHNLKMSQAQFAENFGLDLGTLQNWEQGLRSPSGPARVLLLVIEKQPQIVLAAIAEAALSL